MNEELTSVPAGGVAASDSDARSLGTLVYLLQALGLFLGVTFIAGVVINYIKRADVAGTWVASHFRWQIRTFWFSLLWSFIGMASLLVVVGYFILLADAVWVIYRIVRGWLALSEGREMYVKA